MDVQTVAVLGAGTMGHGIAEVAALAGFDVRLRDVDEDRLAEGYENVEWSLDKLVERGRLTREAADGALDRLDAVIDPAAALAGTELVAEAVPEDPRVKREAYADAAEHAPPEAILVTNTSSLRVTDLAAETDRPGRFCGMHFFNPPVRMDLVEVVPGAETEAEVVDAVEDIAEEMGKTPVRLDRDTPGFVVNRVLVPLVNEAAWLVEAGETTVEAVDATARYELGLPSGVFRVADRVGLDVVAAVLDTLHEELGAAYAPCPLVERTVESGDLGRKTGAGFYDYADGDPGVSPDVADPDLAELLAATMANEAAKLVDAGVADGETVDRALELGAGFAEGPAALAAEYGLDTLQERLADRHAETGHARYEHTADLGALVDPNGQAPVEADGGAGSEFEAVRVETEGAVGRVVVDREGRLNTITPDVLADLEAAVDRFEADDDVRAVLVTGAGDRAFSAGADVDALAGSAGSLDAVELARRGQRAFGRLEAAALPVVAAIDGYCLGGGMELAACADLRVASAGAEFGQVEVELGLVPGWGGTQRLPRIVGEGRAKELVLTGDRYDAETMYDYGFVNEVVESDAETRALELASDLAAGPPVAHRYAKRAVHAGRESEDAGLELEATAFGILVSTEDFSEGIAAFAADRDPEFRGE